ncbi:hypothetical protein DERF_007647 [Dermatophagoides farinae]|uniref:Uncharacterized protein n=1 Tax=Dermatophagoides farinae TaxID=6954 RepID=A0A922I0S6_DERFA|nr:hypothetical protein DERF_007647 [Dermatophagoides farinae]
MNAELNRAFIIFVFEYDKLKQNFGQTTETKQKKIHNEKIVFLRPHEYMIKTDVDVLVLD